MPAKVSSLPHKVHSGGKSVGDGVAALRSVRVASVETHFRFRTKQEFFYKCAESPGAFTAVTDHVLSEDLFTVFAHSDEPKGLRRGQLDCGLVDALLDAYRHGGAVATCPTDWWLPVMQLVTWTLRHQVGWKTSSADAIGLTLESADHLEVVLETADHLQKISKAHPLVDELMGGRHLLLSAPLSTRMSAQAALGGNAGLTPRTEAHANSHSGITAPNGSEMTKAPGLAGFKMSGTKEAWQSLSEQLALLKKALLAPKKKRSKSEFRKINSAFPEEWWNRVKIIFDGLLEIFNDELNETTKKEFLDKLICGNYAKLFKEAPLYSALLSTANSTDETQWNSMSLSSIQRVNMSVNCKDVNGKGALLCGSVGYTVEVEDTLLFKPYSAWSFFLENELLHELKMVETD